MEMAKGAGDWAPLHQVAGPCVFGSTRGRVRSIEGWGRGRCGGRAVGWRYPFEEEGKMGRCH